AQRVREQAARAEAERTTARLQAIQRISDAALGTLALDGLLRELLNRILEALAADNAAVLLHEPDGSMAIYQAVASGEHAAPVHRRAGTVAAGEAEADGG